MLDGQISLLTYHAGIHLQTGAVPSRRGNQHPSITPYETYRARDGFVNIAVGTDAQWRALCHAMGAPLAELATDARFASNAARVERRAELAAILEPLVAARPVGEWLALLDAADIPCGPILDVAAALAHPQVQARAMVLPLDHPTAGPIRVTGVPVKLSETPGTVRTPPPLLGEHTRAILGGELGLSVAELEALLADGTLAQAVSAPSS
jgi:formyl-CoA transferase/CoA:oxalate CoA-transferase